MAAAHSPCEAFRMEVHAAERENSIVCFSLSLLQGVAQAQEMEGN